MEDREHAGASDGKQRHGFRKTVDGVAPRLAQQKKDGGDQRSGVADSDPPDKVDDGESPADGNVHAPHADALKEQERDAIEHPLQNDEADEEAQNPALRNGLFQHDRADFVRNGAIVMARRHYRCFLLAGFVPVSGLSFCSTLLRLSFQFRIRVTNFGQIRGARPGIQVVQQPVIALAPAFNFETWLSGH